MSIYRVILTREESTSVLVEADTEEEAEAVALTLSVDLRDWEESWAPTAGAVDDNASQDDGIVWRADSCSSWPMKEN